MKLSIVTICRNEVARIEETLQSVLNQTFKDYQFVVIDGASTDGTVNVIEKYKDKIDVFISEPDKGIYNAMNKSIDYCEGEYIYFLNGGDFLYSSTTLGQIFSTALSGDLIYGNIAIKEQSSKEWIYEMPKKLTKSFLLKKTIPHQATFTKKELFYKIGKYDEQYKIAADYKFSMEAIFIYNITVQYLNQCFAIFDYSGVSALNPKKRECEKKMIQNNIFGKFSLYLFKIVNSIKKHLKGIF